MGAGLTRWTFRLERIGMVEVGTEALAAGVGEPFAAGDQTDPLLEVGGVLVAGEPHAVGEVLDGPDGDVGVAEQLAQLIQ